TWADVGQVALCTLGGLVLFLGVAAFRKLREGYRVHGRLFAFLLFLLLEHPTLVYGGVLLGLAAGAFTLRPDDAETWKLPVSVGGGAALGILFWLLREVRDRRVRRWLGFALAAALVGGAMALLYLRPDLLREEQRHMIGVLLLLGIPGFYLLTFAGMVEESEVEIAAICAALGVGIWILGDRVSPTFQFVGLALPVALYYVYIRHILGGLRVFKHVLRAVSYARIGQHRWALVSL